MTNMDLINNILSDLGNFVLVVFGFSVTLFTVLYSFVIGKRELLIEYSEKMKRGSTDPIIAQRRSNAQKVIAKFKTFNLYLIVAIFADLIIYLFCILTKYFVKCICIKEYITIGLGGFSLIIFLYISVMLIVTIKDYFEITKI